MNKAAVLVTALALTWSGYSFALNKPADASTPTKTAATVEKHNCKDWVVVSNLSGTQRSGGKTYDYFLQIKNPTQVTAFVDVKLDNFPGSTRLYSSFQKGIKVKAGKEQTLRMGYGRSTNMSLGMVTVQYDKEKPTKKPTISLVNCRPKKK